MGKSTIAASLALEIAQQHARQVIAVEVNGAQSLSSLFGAAPVTYAPRALRGSLDGMTITPAEATEEYLVRMLRFRLLYETVFRNRFVAPLMDGVLGLSDLITMGKVMDLHWERADGTFGADGTGDPRWDLVVVDGPATGHGLSMLRSPRAMMDLAKVGPLFQNSKQIRDLVADPTRFAVVLVTLAEEMPVTEALEALEGLRANIDVDIAGIVVNAVPQPLFSDAAEAQLWPSIREEGVLLGGRAARAILDGERTLAARARAEEQVARLRAAVDVPVFEVPRLATRDLGVVELEQIAPFLRPLL